MLGSWAFQGTQAESNRGGLSGRQLTRGLGSTARTTARKIKRRRKIAGEKLESEAKCKGACVWGQILERDARTRAAAQETRLIPSRKKAFFEWGSLIEE